MAGLVITVAGTTPAPIAAAPGPEEIQVLTPGPADSGLEPTAGWRRRLLPTTLREREFRLWFLGQTASEVGNGMVLVALSFAVLDRFHSASALGKVLTAESVPLVLMLMVGGLIADRLSRRTLLLVSDVVRAVAQALAAALLVRGGWSLWQLSLLFAIDGTASGLSRPALIGMVTDTVAQANLAQANTLRALATNLGGVAGPALAGVLAGLGGGGVALAVNAGTFAVSALCMLLMRPTPAAGGGGASFLADLKEGWHAFTRMTWVWVIVGQYSLFHLLVFPPIIVLGALVAQQHLGGATTWGVILAALGAGSVLGSLLLLRWTPRRPLWVATWLMSSFSLWAAALALTLPWPVQVALAAAVGIGLGMFQAVWDTALTVHVPGEVLSRVSAYDWFGSVALLPVGYALTAPLAALLGVRGTLWFAAATWAVLSIVVLCVRPVTRLPAPPRAPSASPSGEPVAAVRG